MLVADQVQVVEVFEIRTLAERLLPIERRIAEECGESTLVDGIDVCSRVHLGPHHDFFAIVSSRSQGCIGRIPLFRRMLQEG